MNLRLGELVVRVWQHSRDGHYLMLVLLLRVVPVAGVILSGQLLLSNVSTQRIELDKQYPQASTDTTIGELLSPQRAFLDIDQHISNKDISKHKASTAVMISISGITYDNVTTPSSPELNFPLRALSFDPLSLALPTGSLILFSLLVVLGEKYFEAFLIVDVYARETHQDWNRSITHRLSLRINMWLLLIPTGISVILVILFRVLFSFIDLGTLLLNPVTIFLTAAIALIVFIAMDLPRFHRHWL